MSLLKLRAFWFNFWNEEKAWSGYIVICSINNLIIYIKRVFWLVFFKTHSFFLFSQLEFLTVFCIYDGISIRWWLFAACSIGRVERSTGFGTYYYMERCKSFLGIRSGRSPLVPHEHPKHKRRSKGDGQLCWLIRRSLSYVPLMLYPLPHPSTMFHTSNTT